MEMYFVLFSRTRADFPHLQFGVLLMEESLKIITRYNLIIRMQYVLYLQEGVSVFNSDKLPTNVIALNHLYFFNLRLVTQ